MDASETRHRLRAGPAESGAPGMSSTLDQRITNVWINIFILCLDNPSSHPTIRLGRPNLAGENIHFESARQPPLLTHWRRPGQTPPICSPGYLLSLARSTCSFSPLLLILQRRSFLFNLSLISDIDIMVFPLFFPVYSKHSVWDISLWPMNKSLVRVLDSNPEVWEESSVLRSVPRCWGHLFKVMLKWLASLYQSVKQRTYQPSIHEAGKRSEINSWTLCKSQAAALLLY